MASCKKEDLQSGMCMLNVFYFIDYFILFYFILFSHTDTQYSLGFEQKHAAYLVHLLIHTMSIVNVYGQGIFIDGYIRDGNHEFVVTID